MVHHVFITGGTGYLGRPLITRLLERGHSVRALVRPGSEAKLPAGAETVVGNALDAGSWSGSIAPAETLVHLVGTPRPSPLKSAAFERVDLPSIRASVVAARAAAVRHLIYVSVAHPAPVMRAYISARMRGEAAVRESGMCVTVLRPWYVLGPGHRWPYLLIPIYAVARRVPSTSAAARRLGLVSRGDMVAALTTAVEQPPDGARDPEGVRILEVPDIRAAGAAAAPSVFPFRGRQ